MLSIRLPCSSPECQCCSVFLFLDKDHYRAEWHDSSAWGHARYVTSNKIGGGENPNARAYAKCISWFDRVGLSRGSAYHELHHACVGGGVGMVWATVHAVSGVRSLRCLLHGPRVPHSTLKSTQNESQSSQGGNSKLRQSQAQIPK